MNRLLPWLAAILALAAAVWLLLPEERSEPQRPSSSAPAHVPGHGPGPRPESPATAHLPLPESPQAEDPPATSAPGPRPDPTPILPSPIHHAQATALIKRCRLRLDTHVPYLQGAIRRLHQELRPSEALQARNQAARALREIELAVDTLREVERTGELKAAADARWQLEHGWAAGWAAEGYLDDLEARYGLPSRQQVPPTSR